MIFPSASGAKFWSAVTTLAGIVVWTQSAARSQTQKEN